MNPDSISIDTVGRLLLLGLCRLPSSDYLCYSCRLPSSVLTSDPILKINKAFYSLDTCQFSKFHTEFETFKHLTVNAPAFQPGILKFITERIASLYSKISAVSLKEALNISDKRAFELYMDEIGWKRSDDGKTITIINNNNTNDEKEQKNNKEKEAAAENNSNQKPQNTQVFDQMSKLVLALST